jgi:two-component system, cell cycle sensor histidine kinase and response regulator CckA
MITNIMARDDRGVEADRESLERAGEWAGLGSWTFTVKTAEGRWSRQMFRLFGLEPREEVPSVPEYLELIHPEDRPIIEQVLQQMAEGIEPPLQIFRTDPARGPVRYLEPTYHCERDAAGEPISFEGTLLDVTERVLAEAALKESEKRYRALFEANPQPMMAYDLETLAFLAVNDATVAHYGYSREEFLSMTIADIRPEEDIPRLRENVARVTEGYDEAGLWRHRKKDGTIIEVEIRSHTLLFDGKRAEIVLATDVTDRRSLEAQLRHAQKMEAVGRLAGGIAHDFNNLLTVILSYAGAALQQVNEPEAIRPLLEEIQGAGNRAAALTRKLLAFSRKEASRPRALDINEAVRGVESMLGRLLGQDIELRLSLGAGVDRVVLDPGELEQVLLNLTVNARDAMPSGGRVAIETSNVVLDEAFTSRHLGATRGPHVLLTVTDTGLGMDEPTKARIFEPFFTTKTSGKGTGLGLATTYAVVKRAGGSIWVVSEPSRGTTFELYLPAAAA